MRGDSIGIPTNRSPIALCSSGGRPAVSPPKMRTDIRRRSERYVPQESLRLSPRRSTDCRGSEARSRTHPSLATRADQTCSPVVEPGPLHLAFIERKAKWFDEVQNSAGGEAGTACVSGVPVNFGMQRVRRVSSIYGRSRFYCSDSIRIPSPAGLGLSGRRSFGPSDGLLRDQGFNIRVRINSGGAILRESPRCRRLGP